MDAPARVFVGLGANVGDIHATMADALRGLAALPTTQVVAVSSLYRSAPIGAAGPDYLNAVAELRSQLTPHALLAALQAIERDHGRERPYRNAPRTLDLDLLLYGDATLNDDVLTVPHPRMHERAFVLVPLAELAPALRLQGHGSIDALVKGLAGQRLDRIEPM